MAIYKKKFLKNNDLNDDLNDDDLNINSANNRIFNTNFRKKLINKIENIKDKNILINIFNIIIDDIGNNYSSNRNGIFININLLMDQTIDNLNNIIQNINLNVNNDNIPDKIDCKIYKYDEIELLSEVGHKLSNQEKSIINKIRSSKK